MPAVTSVKRKRDQRLGRGGGAGGFRVSAHSDDLMVIKILAKMPSLVSRHRVQGGLATGNSMELASVVITR